MFDWGSSHRDVQKDSVKDDSHALILVAVLAAIIFLTLASSTFAENAGPLLMITSPEEGLLHNFTTLDVTGTTHGVMMVLVVVENTTGTSDYISMSDTNGTFRIPVQLTEGNNKMKVSILDMNLTIISSEFRNLTVNTVYPELTNMYPDHSPVYTNQLKFEVSGWIRHPEYLVRIPEEPLPYNQSEGPVIWWVDLHEGSNRVDVRYSDAFGNEVVVWLIFIVDVTPPILCVYKPWGDTLRTNSSNILFRGTVGGAVDVMLEHKGERIHVSMISGDLDICGTWEQVLELGPLDLEQYVIVRAVDDVGNEAIATVLVIYDILPPSLQVDAPTEGPTTLISGYTDTDIDTVYINPLYNYHRFYPVVDGEFNVLVNLSKGRNLLKIWVRDEAGNIAEMEVEVYNGLNPPKLNLDVPRSSDKGTVVIKGTTDRYVDTIWIDGEPYHIRGGKFSVKVNLTEGDNRFFIEVYDMMGNHASEEVYVERTTPSLGAVAVLAAFGATSLLLIRRRSVIGH